MGHAMNPLWPEELADREFTTPEICRAAQIPTTTLNLWVSRGIVEPLTSGGPGVPRAFSCRVAYRITLAAALVRQGMAIADAYAISDFPTSPSAFFVVDPIPPGLPNWFMGGRYLDDNVNLSEVFGYGPALVPTTPRGSPAIDTRDLRGARHVSAIVVDVAMIFGRLIAEAEKR